MIFYIIAYRDETGCDFKGIPWIHYGVVENKEAVINEANSFKALGYTEVVVFAAEQDIVENMEEIDWNFVYKHKVYEA